MSQRRPECSPHAHQSCSSLPSAKPRKNLNHIVKPFSPYEDDINYVPNEYNSPPRKYIDTIRSSFSLLKMKVAMLTTFIIGVIYILVMQWSVMIFSYEGHLENHNRSIEEEERYLETMRTSNSSLFFNQYERSTLNYSKGSPQLSKEQQKRVQQSHSSENPFALSAGELPGYTGWARPEQTLAGYFKISSSSHLISQQILSDAAAPQYSNRYHSIIDSGSKFSLLLTCHHNDSDTYMCPPDGGTLFYVRAYGPSVITGNVIDYQNTSYLVELYPIDSGEYTVEVVVTFSAPVEFNALPLNWNASNLGEEQEEPGYEGYMVSGFPISILVNPDLTLKSTQPKKWCRLTQLTESSPLSSLTKGYWQVVDHVARSPHRPLTPDDTLVSLDGYRMGLNSVGVRMNYVYKDCELLHIRDIFGESEDNASLIDRCVEYSSDTDAENEFGNSLEQIHSGGTKLSHNFPIEFHNAHKIHSKIKRVDVIFIGDSVMKLETGFFMKLIDGSKGFNVTFIETNGGIHSTLSNVMLTLERLEKKEDHTRAPEKNARRVIFFNSGLHDIDVLCSSKRRRSRIRNFTSSRVESCESLYRRRMTELVQYLDKYPADIKVFRSTTAGWHKYGNYGFTWPASESQPMSRSSHLVQHFNAIAYDIIQNQSSIYITDGYWITLPRPDHTESSATNQVGKHMVHPGYEILSVFARRWLMIIFCALCEDF